MNNETKMISEEVQDFVMSTDELEGDLTEIIDYLQEIRSKYPDAYITWDFKYDWSGDEDYVPYLKVNRPETESEKTERLKREKKYKEQIKAQELRQFENLKKKYGEDNA